MVITAINLFTQLTQLGNHHNKDHQSAQFINTIQQQHLVFEAANHHLVSQQL